MMGVGEMMAKKPTTPMSLAVKSAADAPAKYVIEAHKQYLLHTCQIDWSVFHACAMAARKELPMYCTKPITQTARRNGAENSPCVILTTLPKKSRMAHTVMKVETASSAAL